MPRFFRRIREGVFDEADLRRRAADLAEFVQDASTAYGIEERSLIAVGFSNGANIASACSWSGRACSPARCCSPR